MMIAPGPASRKIGLKIAALLGIRVAPIEAKSFPDGESYIRYTEDSGEDVIIVQSTYPPQDVNLIRLLLLIDTTKELNANSVTAVVSYFAYTRQMRRSRPGEAISVKTIKQGARRVYAACVHPILVAGAREKVLDSGAKEIIGTDSVPSPVSTVLIIPIIAEALKRTV